MTKSDIAECDERLKIALIGPAYPFRGGIAHFAGCLRRELEILGHTVMVANFKRLYPSFLFPGRSQFEPSTQGVKSEGTIDSLNPASWITTALRIIDGRCDVAIIQYWEPFFGPAFGTIARVLRANGIYVLCIVHNAYPHRGRWGARFMARYVFNSCENLIALSDKVADQLVVNFRVRRPVNRLYHPLYDHFGEVMPRPLAKAKLRVRLHVPVILFFGMVRRHKGLWTLLEAARTLSEQLDFLLLVGGEFYEDKTKYEKYVERNQLGNRVRFDDCYVPSELVSTYFGAADVVVLPYYSGTQSGVLSVAIHFERVVVASRLSGLVEAIPDGGGLVFEAQNPEALVSAIQVALTKEFQLSARKVLREYRGLRSWERFTKSLCDDLAAHR